MEALDKRASPERHAQIVVARRPAGRELPPCKILVSPNGPRERPGSRLRREAPTDVRFAIVEAPHVSDPVRLGDGGGGLGRHVRDEGGIEPFDIGNVVDGHFPPGVNLVDGVEIRLDGVLAGRTPMR